MVLKQYIKTSLKPCYARFLFVVERTLGIGSAKKLDACLRFGRRLDLKEPRTLADKVSYISLFCLPEEAVRCTDKWEAREYVASKGLEEILIPVYGRAVSSVEELDFSLFPDSFVLKAAHGCGMNYICKDTASFHKEDCLRQAESWLNTTYGTWSAEPHYRKLPHRVYCEKYLGENLNDYKIHCLNGEPSFIQVCSSRHGSRVCMDLFDLQWRPIAGLQPFRGHVPGRGNQEKPQNLEGLIQTARILSRDFDYVRVDLYELEGQVFFGELTFTPANGIFASFRKELLEKEGEKLEITRPNAPLIIPGREQQKKGG